MNRTHVMQPEPRPIATALYWWAPRAVAVTVLWPIVEGLGNSIGAHYHPAQIVGMRYSVHLLVLSLIYLPRHAKRMVGTKVPGLQIARGLCMFLMPVSFVSALPHMPRDAVWAIFWIAPLFVIALGRWWLRERVPAAIWLIALFGYAGAWLLLRGEALPAPKLAVAGPLVAALAFSCYVVLSRRLREEWIVTSLFYTALGAFCAILPFMVAQWRPVHPADLPAIVGLGSSGLLLLMFLDQSVERVAAGYVAPVLYGAVVFEDLGRALLRQSALGAPAVACIVLIVAAAASTFLLCRRREAR